MPTVELAQEYAREVTQALQDEQELELRRQHGGEEDEELWDEFTGPWAGQSPR